MNTIIEWAPIRLAEGKTEQDLLAASKAFQQDFLASQPGFVRRELVHKDGRDYVDIVHWRSEADAKAIMDKMESSAACAVYFSVMDMGGGDPNGGGAHFASLAVYE